MTLEVIITEGALETAFEPRQSVGAGAVVEFTGLVRPEEAGATIESLHYEAYRPMAEMQLQRLGQRTLSRFDVTAVHVEHSVGRVPVGSASFRLVIASKHRKAALEAVDWFIDTMKQEVPIWKRAISGA